MLPFASLLLVVSFYTLLSNVTPFVVEKRTIDDDLFQRLKLMSQYASAAYCPSNHNSPGTPIKCSAGNCPLVEGLNSSTILEYSRTETPTDVTGFVAVDHTNKLVVVSFRGSSTRDNWLTNLNFGLTHTHLCKGCTAHLGFWNSWKDARGAVVPSVLGAAMQNPTYSIVVTGHSLGGAIAALSAASLRALGFETALYSFGSPRVGGHKLSEFISNQPGGTYRVTHYNDPVPRIPSLGTGYVHISPEYYIEVANEVEVKVQDIKVYRGAVNRKWGNGKWSHQDKEAHRWYFTKMYSCKDVAKSGTGESEGLDVVARF